MLLLNKMSQLMSEKLDFYHCMTLVFMEIKLWRIRIVSDYE